MIKDSTTEKLPPGGFGLPFIGERPRLLDTDYMLKVYQEHGGVIKTQVLGRKVAVFMGHEANRFLLQTGMSFFSWRDGWPPTFKALLGESLFVQDGDDHRQKRKLLMPAFHRQALHNYLATMEDISKRYVQKWEKVGTFKALDENKQFTFEIASTLLTGTAPGDEIERISKQFVTLTSGFLTLPTRWKWTPYGKAVEAREALLAYIDRAIEHRRQDPQTDALSLLVQTRDEEGNALTNHELRSQTLLMLFAGHETSASMLTSLLLFFKQNPHTLAKARAEQDALNIGDALTIDQVRLMPYLDRVLRETERLHPPVPAGFRGVTEPFEYNGYTIPKGWTALYLINVAHRDPSVFSSPNTFDPDRFSPERNEGDVPFSMVGFGGGARVCIGYAFAQLEMKVLLSHLLRFYDWEILPNQNLKFTYFPTLLPRDGLKIRFFRR